MLIISLKCNNFLNFLFNYTNEIITYKQNANILYNKKLFY